MIKIYRKNDIEIFMERFESRRREAGDNVERSVAEILQNVRKNGDNAVFEYARKFDGVDLKKIGIEVSIDELQRAHDHLDRNFLNILRESRHNIERFHSKGLPQSWLSWENEQVVLGQRVTPLERVGAYVPGGRAAYPSSLLMGVVPAKVAGVPEILIVTPSDKDGAVNQTILAAAYELGITKVFRIGGAHAIAALAYGTESIARVDKIIGPGNIYVATAKKLLYGQCSMDMIAGPSEVVIIADESAQSSYVAADLLAQAEHDPQASAMLLTDSPSLADNVALQVAIQTEKLPRNEIIETSLNDFGAILLTDSLAQSIEISNRIAPEHLGLHLENAWDVLGQIKNAGAIFMGSYSPETVGDYWAGPNHILPTNGSARFFSPLRTEDFLKFSSIISFSDEAVQKHGQKIIQFASNEGLAAHANAIEIRLEK